jgi:hypothetical protein
MALGRIVYNGMFEENARPYEPHSMHAIMNLYMGANALFDSPGGRKVKNAARNAMEFLSARYTFQSFEGKRLPPRRRLYKHRKRYGIGNNDYMLDIISMLSGAYVFNDNIWDCSYVDLGDGKKSHSSRYYWENVQQSEQNTAAAYALWTALIMDKTGYTLPPAIHDFLLNKHQGYWARINTIFTKDGEGYRGHYPMMNHDPKYFDDHNGKYVRITKGELNISPEFYFCTPDFLNSAGGHYTQYYDRMDPGWDPFDLKEASNGYNFISVPYTVLPKGDVGRHWGETGDDINRMKDEILIMRGNHRYPFESRNIWTYKNFNYDYIYGEDKDKDRHTMWPQEYPGDWDTQPKAEFSTNRANFRIFDLRSRHGFFVILAQVSKRYSDDGDLWHYGRGFWEIVPGGMFTSVQELAQRVKEYNPESHFPNIDKDGDGTKHYWYKLAVSGDTLQLDQKVGAGVSCQALMKIWDHNGNLLDLAEEHTKFCESNVGKNMPLLDVRAVDKNFRFTGVKYAIAPGNGWVEIFNPFVGERLILDSRDIMNPRRQLHTTSPVNSGQHFKSGWGIDPSMSLPLVPRGETISYTLSATNLFEDGVSLMISNALHAYVGYLANTLKVLVNDMILVEEDDTYYNASDRLLEYRSDPLAYGDVLTFSFDVNISDVVPYNDSIISNVATLFAYESANAVEPFFEAQGNIVQAQVKDPIPEPTTLVLLGVGLLGLLVLGRRRGKRRK